MTHTPEEAAARDMALAHETAAERDQLWAENTELRKSLNRIAKCLVPASVKREVFETGYNGEEGSKILIKWLRSEASAALAKAARKGD